MGLANAHRAQFTEDALGDDVLLDRGECRQISDPRNQAPMTPTAETTPRWFLVISVGIMHKLWAFVRSKEPMVPRGVGMFIVDLDGMWCTVNLERWTP